METKRELVNMTAQEGREALRTIMAQWDAAMVIAQSQGLSEPAAAEVVGRYFRNKVIDGSPITTPPERSSD